jgi:demethylmenaquinone methyltransferase/2-methoxy-6-polyprenyl-1,4-benzoquinol methylase
MMHIGQARFAELPIAWSATDALCLPFAGQTFDVIVSAFLLRNVVDLRRALREQYRVLKPGGRIVALDTTQPARSILSPFIRFHMHTIIPLLGRAIAGASDAYTYLPDSTDRFLQAGVLANHLREAGFENVGFQKRMLGTVAIHWGRKSMGV